MTTAPAGAFKPSIDPPTGGQHPLIRFRGVLKEYRGVERTFGEGTANARKAQYVAFNFINVQVLQSREPYPFPIATIEIAYNTSAETRWAALSGSFRKFLPENNIDLLVGKQQEWEFKGGIKLRQQDPADNEWKSLDGEAFQLTWLEGAEAPDGQDIMDKIVALADGKDDNGFYSALFSDAEIRGMAGYQDVVTSASNRTLLQTLETAGQLKRDTEGVWHKVEQGG